MSDDGKAGSVVLESLPPRGTTHWSPQRKAQVVDAVERGLLTIAQACEQYGLTLQEFVSWQSAIARSGVEGLRVTKFQFYRDQYRREKGR